MSEIETVGIVGAGLMGTGIAEAAAAAGYPVVLVKATSSGTPDEARKRIDKSLGRQVEKGKLAAADRDEILGRITVTADRGALGATDLVIESIVEDLATKKGLFADLDLIAGEHTIFASNTSTLRISEIARGTGREERTIGL